MDKSFTGTGYGNSSGEGNRFGFLRGEGGGFSVQCFGETGLGSGKASGHGTSEADGYPGDGLSRHKQPYAVAAEMCPLVGEHVFVISARQTNKVVMISYFPDIMQNFFFTRPEAEASLAMKIMAEV